MAINYGSIKSDWTIEDNSTNISSNATFTIPASFYIEHIIVENTTANAVLGGIKIGTTNGGSDVVSVFLCPGNSLQHIPDSSINKRVFSLSSSQTLYIQAVTLWNSATLSIHFIIRKFN